MKQNLIPIHIVLFFTRNISLLTWNQNGSLDREVALYLRLQEKGVKISFLTYGESQEMTFQKKLPGIEILYNQYGLPKRLYEILIPFLHFRSLSMSSLFKTNQIYGADVGLKAAKLYKKPLLIRFGYLLSKNIAHRYGNQSVQTHKAHLLEMSILPESNFIAVTTQQIKNEIIKSYSLSENTIHVIPNYVEVDIFKPNNSLKRKKYHVCFIGRLSYEKNLFSLLTAIIGTDLKIVIIGSGPEKDSLNQFAQAEKLNVDFFDNMPNHDLPRIINSSQVFILPSLIEGNPKALLEAMSCGLAVIGTNILGIREIIQHGENGWLCETDAQSIRTGIQHLLANPTLREKLGNNARSYIVENFSLTKVVEMEYSLLQKVVETAK